MVNFKENYHFSRFQGGPTFSRGGGGVQLLIPYRNPYNLWFSRGVRTPCPPPSLDPHLYNNNLSNLSSIEKNQLLLILKTSLLTEFEKKKKENKDSQKGNDFLGQGLFWVGR